MKVKPALASLSLLGAALLGLASPKATAEQIDFSIKAGTGSQAWNTEETMVEVKVGDVLHLVNDDTVPHRLHTTDSMPCTHGPQMLPGSFYDCVIIHPFDPADKGPLYDHNLGEAASFWLRATP